MTAWIVAGCAIFMAAATIVGMIVRYEKRLTRAEDAGAHALQVAAESEVECKEHYQQIEQSLSDVDDNIRFSEDRNRREFGETVAAMQAKIHEFETWSRDEFVRKSSFEAALLRSERAQELRDERLDETLNRLHSKLDALTSR